MGVFIKTNIEIRHVFIRYSTAHVSLRRFLIRLRTLWCSWLIINISYPRNHNLRWPIVSLPIKHATLSVSCLIREELWFHLDQKLIIWFDSFPKLIVGFQNRLIVDSILLLTVNSIWEYRFTLRSMNHTFWKLLIWMVHYFCLWKFFCWDQKYVTLTTNKYGWLMFFGWEYWKSWLTFTWKVSLAFACKLFDK